MAELYTEKRTGRARSRSEVAGAVVVNPALAARREELTVVTPGRSSEGGDLREQR
jgi:hypothetical protein